MQIMIECPDVLFSELSVPAALSGIGARLEAVEDEPAGPWLGVFLASIDITKLTEWDLPAYLRATAKHQAWAASLTVEAVGELASRPGEFGRRRRSRSRCGNRSVRRPSGSGSLGGCAGCRSPVSCSAPGR
jgi:hypothetical protein